MKIKKKLCVCVGGGGGELVGVDVNEELKFLWKKKYIFFFLGGGGVRLGGWGQGGYV